ncbi:MAG: insulinase family protein, partial [Bacteriovoracaceae bacterium]
TISLLHNSHALSLPTLGTYSTIESLNRDDVYSFYKNNYVPNNMILTIIGNFQTASLLPLIKEIYGKVSPGQVIRVENPEWKTGFQTTNGETFEGKVFNRFYDGKEKIVQLFFPLPARKTSEYFHLVNVVLDKEKDGILFSLKSQFSFVNTIDLSTRTSHLGNYLEARISGKVEGDYDAAAKLLTAKLSKISFALSPETVASEAIKKRTDFVKNIEKPHMFGIYYSASLVHGGIESLLSSFSGGGYFPAAKELESLALKNYQFIIVQSPSVKNEKEQIGVSTVTKIYNDSASGKNLIVVQNEANNLLAIHYLIKHKAALESKYGKDAAKIVHNALEQRLNADTNKKVSSKYGFAFTVNDNPFIPMDDIYLHPDFGYIRVEGLADDVAGAIQFLNSHLQGFIPTEEEYKKAVEKFKAISFALAGGDKGKKLFEETYKSVVYAANPYSQLQPALTYENTVAFAKEYLKPSNIVISIVSPAKTDSVDNAFSKLGFSKLDNEPDVFTPTIMLSDKPVTIEKQHGGERSYLFWGFTQKIDVKDAPALLALSLILNDQIVFDIREKQGLAYNISAGIEVIGDKALFYINQGTRPMNVDTLVAQYPRFFKESVLDSLTQDQLEKSINQYLGRIMFRRLSSINKAFYLGNSLYINNDYEYDKKFLDGLRKVTLSDVKTVGKKYLNITNPISVIIR